MEVILDGRKMSFEGVQHEIKLMWQERILNQFLSENGLGWFYHYQQTDIQRLEKILAQAQQQYGNLSGEEKRWIEKTRDFYDDFKRFDWILYHALPPEKRAEYEVDTAIRWARKLRSLTPYSDKEEDILCFLLQTAETGYAKAKTGVKRPTSFMDTEAK